MKNQITITILYIYKKKKIYIQVIGYRVMVEWLLGYGYVAGGVVGGGRGFFESPQEWFLLFTGRTL